MQISKENIVLSIHTSITLERNLHFKTLKSQFATEEGYDFYMDAIGMK